MPKSLKKTIFLFPNFVLFLSSPFVWNYTRESNENSGKLEQKNPLSCFLDRIRMDLYRHIKVYVVYF